jgi:pimeloyl-ACP methyl ester carboxylesterase
MDGQAGLSCERLVCIGDAPGLVGILTEPARPAVMEPGLPLVLLNAGILHDVGPSRLYVRMARSLAAQGRLVLRFDFAGIGDSELRPDGLSFEQSAVLQTQQVMDFLASTRGLDRFVVGGICSGAVTALRVALEDERVAGVALLNPQGYFAAAPAALGSLVKQRVEKSYLLRVSLRRKESWLRLLRGDVELRRLLRTMAGLRLPNFSRHSSGQEEVTALARGVGGLLDRGVRLLQLYAAGDPGLVELAMLTRAPPLRRRRSDPRLHPVLVPDVDHLFTPEHGQQQVLSRMQTWLRAVDGEQVRADCTVSSLPLSRPRSNAPELAPLHP